MSNGRPRRRPIFSGLILILVGSLLLANKFHPDLRIWEMFNSYWPVLLILWGLAKMFDYFAARRTGEAAPRAFTGGEFFLLLLLLVFAGLLGLKEVLKENPEWGGEVHLPWDQTFNFSEEVVLKDVKATMPLAVTSEYGDITVLPEEAPEIRVVALKSVSFADSESTAKERADQVKVEIREESGMYTIRAVDQKSGRRVTVDLEVHMPKQAAVDARTARGNIKITGLTGSIAVDSKRGNVDVRDAGKDVQVQIRRGNLQVSNVKGNVRVSGRGNDIEVSDVEGEASIEGEFSGPIRAKNVAKSMRFLSQRTDLTIGSLAGRLELDSSDLRVYDATGNVSLTTSHKDIRMDNVGGRIRIDNRKGNVELRLKNAPKEEIEVNNESAGIDVTLPANSAFEVQATSRNGDVDTSFEGPGLKKSEQGGTATLEGKLGSRGPQIRLKTTYGTVSVRKGT
ncbi:MAG: DUF4097 family beta strand repeat protein [Acidobacteria bacterium]|nr:DUF4097 family beta strand repeat protein [Acidobacteriota bacterium]MBI3662946.1 DUF4097 family beta strand repeat protein [Acidobacteriota bacterium]